MRCALVLAACAPAAPAPISGTTAAPAVPDTPAPTVAWVDNGFDTPALPAVSADGRAILVATSQVNGSAFPNLEFVIVDRTEAVLARHSVMSLAEEPAMFDTHGLTTLARAHLAGGNRWLADQHRTYHFVPLAALDIDSPGMPSRAHGHGFTVEWTETELTLALRGRAIVRLRAPASWLARDHLACPTCTDRCDGEAAFEAVHVDEARRLAVLHITYSGNDTCWPPSDQQHVLAW